MKTIFTAVVFFLACSISIGQGLDREIVDRLDNSAVTLKAKFGQGSGSVILRDIVINEAGDTRQIAFVLSAAHVVADHRSVRTIIDGSGVPKKRVEFSDAGILQELYRDGRRVGEIKLDAKIIRYSDSEDGHDLVILMVYADKFNHSLTFVQDENYIPPKGLRVVHIGSSNGQIGSNSFTTGNISQTGRLLGGIGSGSGVVFDQTSAPAEPGSSGCMIIRESDGRCLGVLVRGGSSTFNFIVPIRRVREWASSVGMDFLFVDDAECPTLDEILSQPIEVQSGSEAGKSALSKEYPFLIREIESAVKK